MNIKDVVIVVNGNEAERIKAIDSFGLRNFPFLLAESEAIEKDSNQRIANIAQKLDIEILPSTILVINSKELLLSNKTEAFILNEMSRAYVKLKNLGLISMHEEFYFRERLKNKEYGI